MANQFSSQAVFFKRETATKIKLEARIIDFINRLVAKANNSHAHTFRVCLHTVCHVFYGAISKFLVHIIYTYRESQMVAIKCALSLCFYEVNYSIWLSGGHP